MPKLDLDAIPEVCRTGYPAPYDADVAGRHYRRLAGPGGLTDFGVNLCRLEPGAWSSQRHWHSKEDEFAIVLSGEAVLVTNAGETAMRPGDCAAFPKGDGDAHHFVNRSDADAVLLVVGTNVSDDTCTYPDIDMHLPRNGGPFTRKDGTPY
ncbi:MAG: cupin domain-containing protein [Sphingomonadaceae bacterium]|nr:cupin domain-containing protein [Sphingomonadaceae bacterium]